MRLIIRGAGNLAGKPTLERAFLARTLHSVLSPMGFRPTARGAAHRRKRGARTHACRAETRLLSALVGRCYRPSPSAETSGHALRRAMEDENTPNVFSTTCGPLLGDFRGSLSSSLGAARISACATFHSARGGGFLPSGAAGRTQSTFRAEWAARPSVRQPAEAPHVTSSPTGNPSGAEPLPARSAGRNRTHRPRATGYPWT